MLKLSRHALDRLRERTRLEEDLIPQLDRLAAKAETGPGRYHLPLYAKDGALKGWAAYKTVAPNDKLVLATILGPDMLPRGSTDLRLYLRGRPAMTIREKLAQLAKKASDCSADSDGDGKITPKELHQHFDDDRDGKVDMKDYAKHINLHMAHPEWLAQETAELVAENEGVPAKEKKAAFSTLRRRLQSQSR